MKEMWIGFCTYERTPIKLCVKCYQPCWERKICHLGTVYCLLHWCESAWPETFCHENHTFSRLFVNIVVYFQINRMAIVCRHSFGAGRLPI